MIDLSNLRNTSRPKKKVQRVGRGIGSKRGATSGRGGKGDSARAGYRKRFGYEGGQVPLYRKLPIRGFTRGRFVKFQAAVNLSTISQYFQDGETVNAQTLREKGLIPRRIPGGLKILGEGEIDKKVTILANGYSASAAEKLQAKSISFSLVE